jgi:hypothetical protein
VPACKREALSSNFTPTKNKQKTPHRMGDDFANHVSVKGLISRICREFLQLNWNKQPNQNGQGDSIDIFPKKIYKWPMST